jgi:hypothetical protein
VCQATECERKGLQFSNRLRIRHQTERFSCAPLYPYRLSASEAESMTEKQLKTADELKFIIMQEIRKNPNCSSVKAVEIMPASEQSAPHPNWRVSI